MTFNGVIALILRLSPNLIVLMANYVTVVEDRPIMSVTPISSIPLLAMANPQCSEPLCYS